MRLSGTFLWTVSSRKIFSSANIWLSEILFFISLSKCHWMNFSEIELDVKFRLTLTKQKRNFSYISRKGHSDEPKLCHKISANFEACWVDDLNHDLNVFDLKNLLSLKEKKRILYYKLKDEWQKIFDKKWPWSFIFVHCLSYKIWNLNPLFLWII